MSACIWYVSKYVAPPASGTTGGRGYLLMAELAKLGHRVCVITSDSNKLAQPPVLQSAHWFESVDGLTLCWVRTFKYEVAKSWRRIWSWLDFEWRLFCLPSAALPKPDVVVVSSLSLLTVFNGLRWRSKYNCRLIFEVRDIWPLTLLEEGGFSARNPFVRALAWVEKLGYRRADAIVGTMPNLAEHVADQVGPGRAVHCIPMGVGPEALARPEPLPAAYVQAHWPVGKFTIAHVGSIGITNALETFLQCAQAMVHHTGVHFLLVGDGDLRQRFEAEYGHLPNVGFAPKVPKAMVQSVLQRCDLLYFAAHPSRVWRYGQSLNKVIDYMLSGKPIVASYTGFESMVNEAGCGEYVPAGDVLALKNEILRWEAMPADVRLAKGAGGREWLLAHRTYEVLAADYLKILLPRSGDV